MIESNIQASTVKAPVNQTDAEKVATETKTLADANAETQANLVTAKAMHHSLGQDIKAVAEWLVATTRGAIGDVEAAVKAIGSKL